MEEKNLHQRDAHQLKVLVRQRLILRSDVPLPDPDPHPVEVRVVDAVAGRHHPPLGDERAAAGDPFAEESLLDDGHHPRVSAERGVLAAHDSVATGVHFSAF